jgi:hypothetical protein
MLLLTLISSESESLDVRFKRQFVNKNSIICTVQFHQGLWIRIHLIQIRIRIQHFFSIRIRIRIQAKTELLKKFFSKIFLKSKFESNQINNIGVIHPNFFQKVVIPFYL